MIRNYSFSNFYSFRDITRISLEVGQKPSSSGYDLTFSDGDRGNKVVAVVGANGSGKTQLLRPPAFLSWFIADSFTSLEPQERFPFKAHMLTPDEPTEFELFFDCRGEQYRYRLRLKETCVLYESLAVKTSHLFSHLFVREQQQNGEYTYKQKNFGFGEIKAAKLRNNVSVISAAHMQDSALAEELVGYFRNFTCNIHVMGRSHYDPGKLLTSAHFFKEHVQLHAKAVKLLSSFDLGLNGVELIDKNVTDEHQGEKSIVVPYGVHQSKGREFRLSFLEESSGTQSAYVLLQKVLPVLEEGGVAIIDELDNDLHPHMLEALLDLFRFEHSNQHHAQLIFSCHTPEVLNLLAKHQVYLVEKQDQHSDAWRLDQIRGLRADDNLYAKYYAGALGAVPEL